MRWVWVAMMLAVAGCGGGSKPAPEPPRPTATATAKATRTPKPGADARTIAARSHIPVLCYHQIREPSVEDTDVDRQYIVRPSVFARQMQALDQAGYTTITGEQLVDHLQTGAKLPRKPVLLTFDDASIGQYTEAFPVLKRHHFKATFFIMTVVLGKDGWLSRSQVRKLDRAGMEIGSHTWDHKAVPEYTDADWKTEVTDPTRELRKLVGHRVRLFAYPFGLKDNAAIPHLFSAGLRAAFQLAEKLDRKHPLWTIRRIIVPEISGTTLLKDLREDF